MTPQTSQALGSRGKGRRWGGGATPEPHQPVLRGGAVPPLCRPDLPGELGAEFTGLGSGRARS